MRSRRALSPRDLHAQRPQSLGPTSRSRWPCVTCSETRCSTRPSQASEAQKGWARTGTTNARSVGRGSGGWGIGDLLQAPGQAGHVRVVRGMPGRYTTPSVQDHRPSVQMAGRGVTEAFTYGASCSGRSFSGTRARYRLWSLPAGDAAGALVEATRYSPCVRGPWRCCAVRCIAVLLVHGVNGLEGRVSKVEMVTCTPPVHRHRG